jgi:hypothetical protein
LHTVINAQELPSLMNVVFPGLSSETLTQQP